MEVIKTKITQCVDCYKCVRQCTVKAIQIKEGHAHVVPERCIYDGRCVLVCPQGAKEVNSSVEKVKSMISSGQKVIASIAPSFVASFHNVKPAKIYNLLHKLGFYAVEETSIGAYYVAKEYEALLKENPFLISTDCPSLVNLVEKYYPQYLQYLAPVVSPMVAHSILLKTAYKKLKNEDVKVIFIGPCIAKIDEVENSKSDVDGVISFADLKTWIAESNIDIESISDKIAQNNKVHFDSRLYPIEGGFLKTAGFDNSVVPNITSITGFENCKEFFEYFPENKSNLQLIEMMICTDGCINGPLIDSDLPVISRREVIFEYANSDNILPLLFDYSQLKFNLRKTFKNKKFKSPEPTEDDIKILMAKIGKYSKKDELDCGACGYNSCREKARAVFQGMAELEMCLPYMRKKAESRANKIIEKDPNGIVIIDNSFKIIQFNKAFADLFNINEKEDIINLPIENILEKNFFLNLAKEHKPFGLTFEHKKLGKILKIEGFCLEDEELYVGIFVDITSKVKNKERLIKIKSETLEKTQDVIHKQMRVVQEIASLLGETTAETKASLLELIKVLKEEEFYE